MERKKVCVVGLGYVGLPTAALLANHGYKVLGVDVKPHIVETINKGNCHIIEPELSSHVRSAVDSGMLKASLTPDGVDIFIISVPTPSVENVDGSHSPCIDYVLAAAKSISSYIRPGNLLIIESTSPVGTTDKVVAMLGEKGVPINDIFIAYCPERVLPGKAIYELIENDRIIGGINSMSTKAASDFYQNYIKGKILCTSARIAEMTKLAENSFRDVNIAFANELSMVCDDLGIDVNEVIELANHHPRVNILNPGCGVGGHCIAEDPWFIVDSAPQLSKIIRTGREVNEFKTKWVIKKVKEEYRKEKYNNPVIAVLGLSYKPDIDDLRTSPSVKIAKALVHENDAEFLIVEPNIKEHKDFKLTRFDIAIKNADIIVCLVAHKEFKGLIGRSTEAVVLNFCGLSLD